MGTRLNAALWVGLCLLLGTGEIANALFRQSPPPSPPAADLRSQEVRVRIDGRVATTTIEQTYVNYGSEFAQAIFRFRLPPHAAVGELAMWVNGLRTPAAVHPRAAARAIYDEIVQAKRDPALLEALGEGRWQLSVYPVEPGQTQKVQFVTTQVLPVEDGQVVYRGLQLGPDCTVEAAQDLDFSAEVRCPGGVKDIAAVSHALGVQRVGGGATVGFRRELAPLKERIVFSYTPRKSAVDVALARSGEDEGYFVVVLPPVESTLAGRPRRRNVVLVVDTSASMAGIRAHRANLAVARVLANLAKTDTLAGVRVGSDVTVWKGEPVPATAENKAAVKKWLTRGEPAGGTDLAAALRAAESFNTNKRVPCHVFLFSDGVDGVGAGSAAKAAKGAKAAKVAKGAKAAKGAKGKRPAGPPANARVYAFDLSGSPPRENDRLVRLAKLTGGAYASRHGQALDEAMDVLLAASSRPTITDVRVIAVRSEDCELSWNRTRPGQPIIVAGRWNGGDSCTLRLVAKRDGEPVSAQRQITFPGRTDAPRTLFGPGPGPGPGPRRLWAHLRGEAMWRALRQDADVKPERLEALVELSRTHRVVTPATAMLVLESEQDYINRGVRRDASTVRIEMTLAGAQADMEERLDSESELMAGDNAIRHVRELCRLGQYGRAAAMLGESRADPLSFEMRQQAALLGELVALRKAIREERKRTKSGEDALAEKSFTRPWHERLTPRGPVGAVPLSAEAAAAAGAPAADAAASGWRDSPANIKLRRDLHQPVGKLDLADTELADAMDWIRQSLRMNVVVDWTALANVGIGKGTPVSLKLSGVTAAKALKELLRAAGGAAPLAYEVDDGVITVSTKEHLASDTLIRVYDIRDLLPYPPGPGEAPKLDERDTSSSLGGSGLFGGGSGLFDSSPEGPSRGDGIGGTWSEGGGSWDAGSNLSSDGAGDDFGDDVSDDWDDAGAGGDDGVGDGSDDVGRRNSEWIEEILYTIRESIDYENWRSYGGESARIRDFMGTLIVTQTSENHAKVADLLTQIRQTTRSTSVAPPAPAPEAETRLPEALFTRDGCITEWVERLLASAREGKLSAFSSVKLTEAGGRKFARIGGVFFETSLTGRCRIHLIARGGGAKAALLGADPSLEACFALGPIVIVRAGERAAVSLDAFGITEADDKRLKALLKAIPAARAKARR